MDWVDLAIDVGKGWLRFTCSVAAGITPGVLLEATGWLKKLSAAWSPATKYYHLPAVCGSSFLLAFASPSSANSLLASWFSNGRISRITDACLTRKGVFTRLNQLMPPSLSFHISAESLSIITSHPGGRLNAAAIASPFPGNGALNNYQVFTTLVIGYVISLPLRTIRHALPMGKYS